jgi:hypothetical protein
MRAGGGEPALRPQPGRNDPLINFYQRDKRQTKNPKNYFH